MNGKGLPGARLVAALAVAATLALCPSAWAAARVTITTATVGPPGSSVALAGSGFDPSTSVDVFLDPTNVAIATSSSTGAVSKTITIPPSAQPGAHWITLTEGHTRAAAQAQFFVRTDWPQSAYGASGRRSNPLENTLEPS